MPPTLSEFFFGGEQEFRPDGSSTERFEDGEVLVRETASTTCQLMNFCTKANGP